MPHVNAHGTGVKYCTHAHMMRGMCGFARHLGVTGLMPQCYLNRDPSRVRLSTSGSRRDPECVCFSPFGYRGDPG